MFKRVSDELQVPRWLTPCLALFCPLSQGTDSWKLHVLGSMANWFSQAGGWRVGVREELG